MAALDLKTTDLKQGHLLIIIGRFNEGTDPPYMNVQKIEGVEYLARALSTHWTHSAHFVEIEKESDGTSS